MRVLLDTQSFIVLSDQGAGSLSKKTRELVEDADTERLLSSISITEIAIKNCAGKSDLGAVDVSKGAEYLRCTLLPYTKAHAMRLFDLPLHHRDPFDRMLIATALSEGVPILSADREFKRYRGLSVIW